MVTSSTTQLRKLGRALFSLKQSARALESEKPLVSLRGILKGVKISEKQIKAARSSLFKKYR
ncbi:MAG: hypothetical protein Greene041679_479 [Parcubacteria group bacterium Greene0416_79]|nr:MAG: hypothetical protein Greene041679_479 [Parcubacteria group bacterium Greene0416_79]